MASAPQPMENIERFKFYQWLAEADYTGPVGLTAKFTVDRAQLPTFLDIMRENIAFTRRERGVLQYDLTPCYERPDVFFLLEKFQSRGALLTHVRSTHYANCQRRFNEEMGEHPRVQLCFYTHDPVSPEEHHNRAAESRGQTESKTQAHLVPSERPASRDADGVRLMYRSPSFRDLVANPYVASGIEANRAAGALSEAVVTVRDARALADQGRVSADVLLPAGCRGFGIAAGLSDGADCSRDERVARCVREAEAIAKQLTGAPVVTLASHVLRTPGGEGGRGAGYYVHNDFHEGTRDGVVAMLSGSDSCALRGRVSAAALKRGRMVMINVWRHWNTGPLQRTPLGVCDARSVSAGDVSLYEYHPQPPPADYGLPLPNLLTQSVASPAHAWYYYPEMLPTEALVFKTFDSAGTAPQNGVGVHGAFELPNTPADAPSRVSFECRVFCVWPGGDAAL